LLCDGRLLVLVGLSPVRQLSLSIISTTIVFYKPFFASTFYCLNYLADTSGWMLWHNPFTDSIVAVLMILLLTWTFCSVVVSLPVLVCFFFFTIMFFIPPVAYFASTRKALAIDLRKLKKKLDKLKEKKSPSFENEEKAFMEKKTEKEAATLIFKRLLFYSTFSCLVFGVYFYPFYEGEGYVSVLERAKEAAVPSLRFWAPNFSLSFSWPHVSFPSQFGLGLSLAVFSMEYALMAGQVLLAHAYPKGFAFDGMYEKLKEKDEKEGMVQDRRMPADDAVKAITNTTSHGSVELLEVSR
jgi:hypothetical protein